MGAGERREQDTGGESTGKSLPIVDSGLIEVALAVTGAGFLVYSYIAPGKVPVGTEFSIWEIAIALCGIASFCGGAAASFIMLATYLLLWRRQHLHGQVGVPDFLRSRLNYAHGFLAAAMFTLVIGVILIAFW